MGTKVQKCKKASEYYRVMRVIALFHDMRINVLYNNAMAWRSRQIDTNTNALATRYYRVLRGFGKLLLATSTNQNNGRSSDND